MISTADNDYFFARTLSQRTRSAIVSGIERAPGSAILLSGYNVALRILRSRYRARTYFGATMLCDPRDMLQQCVLHFGVWEPNVSAVLERLLSPGDVCVDIGANMGYDSLLASHRVGPQGAVIAIEASPSIFEMLSKNVGENRAWNIRLVNMAVSDEPGVASLYLGPRGNLGLSTILPERGFSLEAKVKALPLDEILTADERARVKLIKMDIEGGEGPVMERLVSTLELYRDDVDILVEVSPSDKTSEAFSGMLAAGFKAYEIQNSYSRNYYLHKRRVLAAPRRIDRMPIEQTDVLFTKAEAPQLGQGHCAW